LVEKFECRAFFRRAFRRAFFHGVHRRTHEQIKNLQSGNEAFNAVQKWQMSHFNRVRREGRQGAIANQ